MTKIFLLAEILHINWLNYFKSLTHKVLDTGLHGKTLY